MAFPPLSPELLQLHWEELESLWGRRQPMLRSPLHTLGQLADLDERIEAHVQGLLVGGEAITPLVEPGLGGDEPLLAFAAAFTLLRSNREATVLDAFHQAEAGRLDGIRQALCHASVAPVASLRSLLASSSAAVAVAAAEVLAFHQAPESKTWPADRFLKHEAPTIRRAAWRVVSLGAPCSSEAYRAGLRDEDLSVRREALEAAAWQGHQNVMGRCWELSTSPETEHGEALLLLAILGKPEQVQRILEIGQADELGARRFRILGAFGHPAVVEVLLKGMESKDPRAAVAAGAAFTKITGADIASDRRVPLPPEDGHEPDEFEKEFLDEGFLPSPELARAHWQKVEPQLRKGTRWCRGLDLSKGDSRELWNQLGMGKRSRVEVQPFPAQTCCLMAKVMQMTWVCHRKYPGKPANSTRERLRVWNRAGRPICAASSRAAGRVAPPTLKGFLINSNNAEILAKLLHSPNCIPLCRVGRRLVCAIRGEIIVPVVADALEEAGCEDAGIIEHWWKPGPHYRECFAVAAILGKV